LKKAESDRSGKGSQVQTLEGDRSVQEEALARLTKENKNQSETNDKLKKEFAAAQERLNDATKDKTSTQRHVDELENRLNSEGRDRFDVERENQQLESKLRAALNKIDQLTHEFLEMEHRTKMKERELVSAYARAKDEALQAQRLEQQVTGVGNTLQSMGRRVAVASRYQ